MVGFNDEVDEALDETPIREDDAESEDEGL